MNTKLRRKIKKKLSEFLDNCTIHGVRYLSMKTHLFNKLLWLTLVLASFTLCFFMSRRIWTTYVDNPTVTVVQTAHYPTASVPFPAVTICDTNMVYLPNTKNVTNILTKRGYDDTLIDAFYDSLSNFHLKHSEHATIIKMHALLQDIGIPINLLLKWFSKPCAVLVKECLWRSVPHNCTDMFRTVLNHNGYCCRFDIQHFRMHTLPETNLEAGYQQSEGLQFTVNRESEEITSADITERDIDIYITEPNRPISLMDNSVVLAKGTRLEFVIDAWVIDTSDGVKKLKKDARKCMIRDSNDNSSYFKGCISKGFHKKVFDDCRCLPFYYKINLALQLDLPNCTWEQHACVYKTLNKLKGQVAEIASVYNCYPDCEHIQYETQVDYVRHTISTDYSSNGNTDVIIRFFGSTCVKYRRELLFTWDQLLASLGGLFGLCTGGSILSVIELLFYLLDIALVIPISWLKVRNSSKKTQPTMIVEKKNNSTRSNIFVIKPKYSYVD